VQGRREIVDQGLVLMFNFLPFNDLTPELQVGLVSPLPLNRCYRA